MEKRERLFWVFAILMFMNGCKRPVAKATIAPAIPSCPAGYKPVSSHPGRGGVDRGHGFTIVHYTLNGKPMHLFCTQDDGLADPRISKPLSGAIPESK